MATNIKLDEAGIYRLIEKLKSEGKIKVKEGTISLNSFVFDEIVSSVYGIPYCFQQQNGCMGRGGRRFKIDPRWKKDTGHDEIPRTINGEERCVKFDVWSKTLPSSIMAGSESYMVELYFYRNYYPDIKILLADLCNRGILREGYINLKITW